MNRPLGKKSMETLMGGVILLTLVFWGCQSAGTATDIGAAIGVAAGVLTESQAESLKKTTVAVARTFQDITPEQEYYIGRAVGATLMSTYSPDTRTSVTRYINQLGQTLSRASDMPETFAGYHFLILDADEINAFAAPGGLIFITRGMLRCCRNEDALAAVLAHEIGHVQSRHGLQAIRSSRITAALTTIGVESAKTLGGENLASLTQIFEGSISDITRTLVTNGYSREFERQADQTAVTILRRVGYPPFALVDMLQEMKHRLKPEGFDFAKTHPPPESRIRDIQTALGPYMPPVFSPARETRFHRVFASK